MNRVFLKELGIERQWLSPQKQGQYLLLVLEAAVVGWHREHQTIV
jgi:hypothetical protein